MMFEIAEGPETYVERINISGNTRSEEKILPPRDPDGGGRPLHEPEAARGRSSG